MPWLTQVEKTLRRLLLGDTDLPQQCLVPMPDPQDEISVWLDGAGAPRDVTDTHLIACPLPFTIGLGMQDSPGVSATLSLQFRERHGQRALLGEVFLRASSTVQTSGPTLRLFDALACRNYCLPWARLRAHYMRHSYVQWRGGGDPEVPMSSLARRSMIVFYICPRPVVLVSVMHGEEGNIFPMNLLGEIGKGYLAFALNSSRQAAPLVERAGRLVFSTVPYELSESARKLGGNHRKKSVRWDQLPFETMPSTVFGVPVPRFALRLREMEIEAVRQLGTHTLFVARVVNDERRAAGPQFSMIHGIYQARKLRAAAKS
jgi:flavin reductase (DIM6/NTAB) family NADH-FMN oxidoreductase RutF